MIRHNNLFAARFFRGVFYNTYSKDVCKKISTNEINRFTREELTNMLIDLFPEYHYQELQNHITALFNRLYNNYAEEKQKIDFFDVLFDFSDEMLVRSDNQYRFRYMYTDIWRTVVKEIGEEIFVISAIVKDDIRRGIAERSTMDWTYCIEHDNHELISLLKRDVGISDNHFHLRGSSPYFDVSWVYLMNNVSNIQYERAIKGIEAKALNNFINNKAEYPLRTIWRKACAIRLFLFLLITKSYEEEEISALRKIIINTVLPYDSDATCLFPIKEIQDRSNSLNQYGTIDYAHKYVHSKNQKYYSVSGERYILYNCLRKIQLREDDYILLKQMLFLYILFKHRFYVEFVQSNSRIGFYNFNQYQSRKDGIIPWNYERTIATDTISSVIESNRIHRIEFRISPQKSKKDMIEVINMYDAAISDAIKQTNSYKKLDKETNFFYTLHFVKRKETVCNGLCRHHNLRHDIENKALVISDLHPSAAKRIFGIDACGEEMDCRPEVFAPIFRFLLYYTTEQRQADNTTLHQLKATYHVGEDNYDLTDGLRAIDEAITFLDLRSGCRLGHATLLGLSPDKYYREIRNPLAIPAQNFLDNVVWMYFYFEEHEIQFDGYARLKSYLKERFEWYFHEIYSYSLDSLCWKEQWDTASKFGCYKSTISQQNFDIYQYYLSYLLRGDDPSLYKDGFYGEQCTDRQSYRICNTKERMKEARSSFVATHLYYLYHYNQSVKTNGQQCIHEKLPSFYLEGLALIQSDMKRNISHQGIGIETNPSSNIYINSIKDYSDHPITDFYDNALRKTANEVQLNVSINTDDKSVFSTSLSNEYAYLLFYLENQKDSNGHYLYSRFEIMKWLDEIRKMGNEQSFAH